MRQCLEIHQVLQVQVLVEEVDQPSIHSTTTATGGNSRDKSKGKDIALYLAPKLFQLKLKLVMGVVLEVVLPGVGHPLHDHTMALQDKFGCVFVVNRNTGSWVGGPLLVVLTPLCLNEAVVAYGT